MRKLLEEYLYKNNYFEIVGNDMLLHLKSHFDYPGLRAVTDTLDYFNVANIAVSVPKDNIMSLPDSFLALLNEVGSEEVVLVYKQKNGIRIKYQTGISKSFSIDSFKEVWTGSIIAIETSSKNTMRTIGGIKGIKAFLVLCLILSACGLLYFYSLDVAASLLFIISMLGLYLSYLIVKEEIGLHGKTASKICSVIKDGNCADVINSNTGKIFSAIALSDLCVSYFVGSVIAYLLMGINQTFLLVTLLMGVPVVVFSIYQQAVVLKQWCALCLGVIGILLAQAVVIGFSPGQIDLSPDVVQYSLRALLIFTLTFTVWYHLKEFLFSHIKLPKVQVELLKFKRNQKLFKLLQAQTPIFSTDKIPEEHVIQFGVQNPRVKIDGVTNPMCGFCADAFNIYKKLREKGEVQINIIFNVSNADVDNDATRIALRIVEIYQSLGSEEAWRAMCSWYKDRNIEKWQSEFGPHFFKGDRNLLAVLVSHESWCNMNKINFTPATIIDNYLFPKEYIIDDLPIVISDILLEKGTVDEKHLALEV